MPPFSPVLPGALAPCTTLRLGGPAARLDRASTADELVDLLRIVDSAAEPALLLGGGSNVVIADDGVPGPVVVLASSGRVASRDPDGSVLLAVEAGEDWDGVVAATVADGLGGLECLSGIPGRAGATPVQNVGAYGVEIADVLVDVDLYDRPADAVRPRVPAAALGLGYRTSVLRGRADAVVLRLRLRLSADGLSAPVRYEELAGVLGVAVGTRVPVAAAREAVLALRRRKGMVLDPADHDTWSVGSFFTNPVVPAADAPDGVRSWPAGPGLVKLSAAALMERAGFRRGHPGPGGRVALSGKHVLALTHRGGGTTRDLLALAREVRDGVRERLGVELVPEPVLVGCSL
ncbi:MAG: UDP-N-acetylmuramate dehydrogenase [Pseudonocardia sp.]